MYKIDYYTLSVCGNGEVGNVKQFTDTWYTETTIPSVDRELRRIINVQYGENKYIPVITKIEKIEGHCDKYEIW